MPFFKIGIDNSIWKNGVFYKSSYTRSMALVYIFWNWYTCMGAADYLCTYKKIT